jgi:3-oxoacyl-[acyl-carrier protein] reductase
MTRRVAIVTGASRRRGIGAATCLALARAGIDIFFTHWSDYDRTMPWGTEAGYPEALRQQVEGLGVKCEHLGVNFREVEAAGKVMEEVEVRLGMADILVNNVTHDDFDGSFERLNAGILDTYYEVNIRTTMLLSVEFARRFMSSTGGRVINLTSGQSLGPMPGKLPYIASKGAIEAFTVTFAAEVAVRGITVNAVDPGPTDTGWMTEGVKRELLPRFPMGRIGQAEDAARLIAFLASEGAEWITGQVIHSNGGFR